MVAHHLGDDASRRFGIALRSPAVNECNRAAIKGLNLPLFAADSVASPAITAVAPDRVEADQIQAIVKAI